ncbi:hypothetical protein NE857_15860 [Nocardiopsis exhalans]|uniref:Uncharacterized protein n=1 Tax=Nocardiopsis exhalans TaxID=163604 RepID=A0ABY5DG05_9ACTN|nr:hypothetical protein [Nocardiopsis exhalans]USY22957.1 hypothetical protein NE857_15860 [Nocardiopsis exhalans]
MTPSDDAPARPPVLLPEDYLDRLPWGPIGIVFALLALPPVVVAVLLSVAAPWFLSHHGVLINGEPHLYAPLEEFLPGWARLVALVVLFVLVAYSWTAAVGFQSLVHNGRPRPLRTALRDAIRTLPATVVAFTAPVGLYLLLSQALSPVWAVPVWSLLFVALPPLWFPLAGVALGPGAWREALSVLLRRPLRRGWILCLLAPPATLAVVEIGFDRVTGPGGAMFVLALAVAGLTLSARALTLAALFHRDTDRFEQGTLPGPGEPGEDGEEDDKVGPGGHALVTGPVPIRSWAPTALAGAVLVWLWVPVPLFERTVSDGPWDVPRYDQWSTSAGKNPLNEPSLLLAPDGSVVVLGSDTALCAPSEECDTSGESNTNGPTMITDDGLRSVRLPNSEDDPPGSVIWEKDGCGGKKGCLDDDVLLLTPSEADSNQEAAEDSADGDRTIWDWQDNTQVWMEEGDGRAHVVSAVPSSDSDEATLTLFVCQNARCSHYSATGLTDTAEYFWSRSGFPSTVYGGLVDIAVAPDGSARVSVHNPNSGALTLYSCAGTKCAEVTETDLVPASDVTRTSDLNYRRHAGAQVRVRPDGTPAIAYRDTRDGAVRFLDCADEHCERFTSEEVFGPGWNRPAPAMDLDPQGLPRLLGHDLESRTIEYVSCTDASCAETESATVGSYPAAPGWVALRVDDRGRPVMAWLRLGEEKQPDSAEVLRCEDSACSALVPADRR